MAAATAGLDADNVACFEAKALLLLDRARRASVATHHREASGLALAAALHAPGREAGAVEIGLQLAGSEHAIGLAETEPAAELAGAAGILAQREFLDSHRQVGLLQLQGNDPG